jgi:hypothetical protein
MRARRLVMVAAAGAVLVACLLARPASAQPTKQQIETAKKHYADAQKAMAAGDYSIAAREYGMAYAIMKDPILFFNMADAQRLAGNCKIAVAYYGRYLKEAKPSEKNAKLAKEHVEACNKKLGKTGTGTDTGTKTGTGTHTGTKTGTKTGTGTGTKGDTGTMEPDLGGGGTGTGTDTGTGTGGGAQPPSFTDQPSSWKRTAAWVSVGVAMAFATTGAVLGLSASSREEDIQNLINFREATGQPKPFTGTTKERYEDLIDEGKKLDRFSKMAFVVAGAGTAAAITFFILDAGAKRKSAGGTASSRTRIVPIVSADGLGFGASLEF